MNRFRTTLAAVETILASSRIRWRIDDRANLHELDDPAVWLMGRVAADESALICNGNDTDLVSLSLVDTHQHLYSDTPDARLFHLGVQVWRCTPPILESAFALLGRLGPAMEAYVGDGTLGSAAVTIREQYSIEEAAGLLPTRPPAFGWINYWSAETCWLVGFSPTDARCALFARVERCEGGGVVFQITDEPLDLTNQAHRATLEVAWDAFPSIPRKPGRPRPTA